eukprot:SAG31_NODE_928_length_10927_cov_4.616273_7_plen_161_part_00
MTSSSVGSNTSGAGRTNSGSKEQGRKYSSAASCSKLGSCLCAAPDICAKFVSNCSTCCKRVCIAPLAGQAKRQEEPQHVSALKHFQPEHIDAANQFKFVIFDPHSRKLQSGRVSSPLFDALAIAASSSLYLEGAAMLPNRAGQYNPLFCIEATTDTSQMI